MPASNSTRDFDRPLIDVQPQGDVCVIRFLTGVLRDRPMADQMYGELHRVARHFSKFVISFRGVEYLSSQALGNLITLRQNIMRQDGDVRCCELEPQVEEMFKLARLHDLFGVYETQEAAVASFS